MVVRKHEIEAALLAEKQEINAGRLKEDSPLDDSEGFLLLCDACRKGDLKVCQEKIQEGVNINARDRFDYTPLILVNPSFLHYLAQALRSIPIHAYLWESCVDLSSLPGQPLRSL